jgi:hypothetical protein
MSVQTDIMSHEDVQRNIDRLIAKHELLNGKMNRAALLLFGFAALYVLVNRSLIGQLDLGYFNLTDMQLVRSLVGPGYAAYYLYFIVTGFEMAKVRSVLGRFMGEVNPFKHNNAIMSALDVRSALLPFAFYDYLSDAPWERLPKLLAIVASILFVAVFLALFLPMAFTVYILWKQYSGALDVLGWCSTIATSVLFVLTLFIQFLYFRVSFAERMAYLNGAK